MLVPESELVSTRFLTEISLAVSGAAIISPVPESACSRAGLSDRVMVGVGLEMVGDIVEGEVILF